MRQSANLFRSGLRSTERCGRFSTRAGRSRRRYRRRDRPLRIEILETRRLLDGAPFPTPTAPLDPPGSLIYDSTVAAAAIDAAGEIDELTIPLDAGQTITVVADPGPTLRPAVQLIDPFGAELGAAAAGAPGQDAVLQTIGTTAPGTYTVKVSGEADTTGAYAVRLVLGAAVEDESHDGPADDAIGSAQDAGAGFTALGDGSAARAAVLGFAEATAADFFRLDLADGDRVTVAAAASGPAGVELELYDADANLLAKGIAGDSADQVIPDFRDGTTDGGLDAYFVRVAGADTDYSLVITRNADFDYGANDDFSAAQQVAGHGVLGHVAGSATAEEDWYRIDVTAGDELVLETFTPADAAGEPVNVLDPAVELYDPAGHRLLVFGTVAPDGRNMTLAHTATESGVYRVRVFAEGGTAGEYYLDINGSTGQREPLQVIGTDPAGGALLSEAPSQIRVDFSRPVRLDTLAASDLSVDGVPATGVAAIDGDTVVFDLPSGLLDGLHDVSIATAMIEDLQGTAIAGFGSQWTIDTLGPDAPADVRQNGPSLVWSEPDDAGGIRYYQYRVDGGDWTDAAEASATPGLGEGTYTFDVRAIDMAGNIGAVATKTLTLELMPPHVSWVSMRQGDRLGPGRVTIAIEFDKLLDAGSLDASDFVLTGLSGGTRGPNDMTGVSLDGRTTALVSYADLPDDDYTWTVMSGDGRVEDRFGNDLDGEAPAVPIPPGVSGDGTAGGDFLLHFTLDLDEAPLPGLSPVAPPGGLIYDRSLTGVIDSAGDTDTYAIDLDKGQTATLVVRSGEGLRPTVELRDAAGGATAGDEADSPGAAALVETAAIGGAGTYRVTVGGFGDSTGAYSLRVVLNAAAEREASGGPGNNDAASAQDLSGSFIAIGDGSTSRGAVLGTADGAESDYYRFDLADGRSATITLAADGPSEPAIELYDGAGTLLAKGVAAENVDQVIHGFHDATGDGAADSYVVRVTGGDGDYSLVVTRGADFRARPADGAASRLPDVTTTGTVLGAVGTPPTVSPVTVDHVIHISLDGMRGDLLEGLVDADPSRFAAFKRLEEEGAFTYNARTDYTHTNTLPDHTSMFTGRPVLKPAGRPKTIQHGWTYNSDSLPGVTLHDNNPYVEYIASVFDVVHDAGLSTSLFAGKTKFSLYEMSYNEANGAPDTNPAGGDNGRGKIDVSVIDLDTARLVDTFLGDMIGSPKNYSFVHLRPLDYIGHASGWGSPAWNDAAAEVDEMIGRVLMFVENSPEMAGDTDVIVTADHGGTGFTHYPASAIENYRIPFFVWGPGVPAGADLYAIDPYHDDPGDGRPDYNATRQPIRNGGSGNLALELLGLPPIPGSTIGASRPETTHKYAVHVEKGDQLVVRTFTPPGGEPAPAGRLDPALELYDPDGRFVLGDDDGAPDGRNAMLSYTADVAGTYTVGVVKAGKVAGQYVLQVQGARGVAPGPAVAAAHPGGGRTVAAFPTTLAVDFSEGILATSVEPGDLRVGGLPALGAVLVDGDTVRFQLDPAADAGTGVYHVELPAGAVSDLQGRESSPWLSTFKVDAAPPVLESVALDGLGDLGVSSVAGSVGGIETLDMTFSEAVRFTADDVLVERVSFPGGREVVDRRLAPQSVAGSGSDTMTVTLPAGAAVNTWVKVTLRGQTVTDLVGNALDGDPPPAGSGRGYLYDGAGDLPTGDGEPGGDAVFYVGNLRADLDEDQAVGDEDLKVLLSEFGAVNETDINRDGITDAQDVELVRSRLGNVVLGDLDANAIVDAGDLAILLSVFGGGGPEDLDGSGIVDDGDLNLLLAQFGRVGEGDIDRNGVVDQDDVGRVVSALGRTLHSDLDKNGKVDRSDLDLLLSDIGASLDDLPPTAAPLGEIVSAEASLVLGHGPVQWGVGRVSEDRPAPLSIEPQPSPRRGRRSLLKRPPWAARPARPSRLRIARPRTRVLRYFVFDDGLRDGSREDHQEARWEAAVDRVLEDELTWFR